MRKIMSLLLALCLIVGLVPLAVSAEDNVITTEDALSEALSTAQENTTIKIGEGTFNQDISISKNGITLEGAGPNTVITGKVTITGDNVTLKNLNFQQTYEQDAVFDASGCKLQTTGTNLTLEGCTVERTNGTAIPYGWIIYYGAQSGTLKIKKSQLIAPVAGDKSQINSASPSVIGYAGGNVTLNVSDSTISTNGYAIFNRWENATYKNVDFCGLSNIDKYKEVDSYIKTGEGAVKADVEIATCYMALNSTSVKNVSFDDCTFSDMRSWGMLVAGDTLSVTNCTFENNNQSYAICITGAYGGEIKTCTISDNTFDLEKSDTGIVFVDAVKADSTVNVTDNTFKNVSENGFCVMNVDQENGDYVPAENGIIVTGSIFKNCDQTFVGAVNQASIEKNGVTTFYKTLEEAIEKATDGDTVTLNTDVTLDEHLTLDKDNVTIDGNHHTISYTGSTGSAGGGNQTSSFVLVTANGVTLKDVIINTKNENADFKHGVQFYCVEGGKLDKVTIKGGYYTAVQVNGSTGIEISGCTLTSTGYAHIEYGVGENVNTVPSIIVKDNTFTSNENIIPNVWADETTVERIKNMDAYKDFSDDQIKDLIEKSITNNGTTSVTVAIRFEEDGAIDTGTVAGQPQPEEPTTPPVAPTYTNTVTTTENGKVTVSPTSPKENDTVTVTTTPNEGYKVGSVAVTDADGKTVTVINAGGGKYTFKQPDSKVTITVTFVWDSPFTDVGSAWYTDAIQYVYENGLMAGTGDTTFDPEMKLTRAMTAQILYNLEGKPEVTEEATFVDMDVAPTWSVDAIAWAQDTGVVAGMGDDTFAPNDDVTREQFAQMMYNYAVYKDYDLTKTGDLSKFPDEGSISTWAEVALSWANGNGLINGHEDTKTIDPQGDTIRAQAASILMNFDLNLVK